MRPNHKEIGAQLLHCAGNHLERSAFLDVFRLPVIAKAIRVQKRDQLLGHPEALTRNVFINVVLADPGIGQLSLRQREERMDQPSLRVPSSPKVMLVLTTFADGSDRSTAARAVR